MNNKFNFLVLNDFEETHILRKFKRRVKLILPYRKGEIIRGTFTSRVVEKHLRLGNLKQVS